IRVIVFLQFSLPSVSVTGILQYGDDWAGSRGVSKVTVPVISKLASVLPLCDEAISPARVETLTPVTLRRSPAAPPSLFLSVRVKVALVEYSLKLTTCPSRAVKATEVSPAVTVVAMPIAVGRLKQFGVPTCRAQGGVIAICAPHGAHDTDNNTNTKTHDAPEISRNIGWETSKCA